MASSSSSSPELFAATTSASSYDVYYSSLSRDEVLEDLSSRFILNLPEEELASVERVCFQVEQAHWYYEDFIREQNPSKFSSYTLKTFSEALFHSCPLLAHWAKDHDRTFESFMKYKTRVPVCGAIMLNDTWDKCVLVKGWKSSAGWGFPKGKINQQEPKYRCAIREVLEETGYNLENQLNPQDVIQLSIKEQSISLYIVPGVPEDFPFETKTRKEISKISWFKLSDLPTWKRNKSTPGKFYLITPFIGHLKAFIHDRKPRNPSRPIHPPRVPDVKEEFHSSSEDDSVAANDQSSVGNAQEISSQASSAEPQTPSPQYSAARVHQATFEASISSDTTDPARHADVDNGNHLANLLSGLQRSAASLVLDEDDSTHLAKTERALLHEPAPHSHSLAASPAVSPDWSAPHVPPSTSQYLFTSTRSPPASSSQSDTLSDSATVVAPSISPSLASRVGNTGTGHTRRSSTATADISPYLSNSRNITKEMRYISILESVAQESDRASSRMGNRSAFQPASHPTFPVPPVAHPSALDQSVIYSSTPAPVTPQPFYQPSSSDDFLGRPRTSHAFHSHTVVPRQSMNEQQLRALLPLHVPWNHGTAYAPSLPPPHLPTNPLRSVHPQYPVPTPNIASHNAIRANNAQLLSILNTPNPVFRA